MLIKQADDQSELIAALEREAAGTTVPARRASEELRIRNAGIRGERDSAYLIDFHFAQSKNWAVIHDLRLEHQDRVAQIDHLLINRWMDVYVLESKHFHAGVKITEEGEFLAWNSFRRTYEGMPSPLEQNDRHIAVLKAVMATIELPTRLGVRIPPRFQSLILVAPKARIDRPKYFDDSRVIKADQLRKRLWKDIDQESTFNTLISMTKLVSSETIEAIARSLARLHRPLPRPSLARPAAAASINEPPPGPAPLASDSLNDPAADVVAASGPRCKQCGSHAGTILYGRYGYYFQCNACATNTAIRFTCQPGHRPRLRKAADTLFRECAECGSSEPYHRNPAAGPGNQPRPPS